MLLNVGWAIYNYHYTNFFFIGNVGRYKIVKDTQNEEERNFAENKWTLFSMLFNNYKEPGISFYYFRYDCRGIDNYKKYSRSPDSIYFDFQINEDFKKIIFREFYAKNNWCENLDSEVFSPLHSDKKNVIYRYFDYIKNPKSWIMFLNLETKIFKYAVKNNLFLFVYVIAFFFSIYLFVKNKYADKISFLLLCFGSIHIVSILLITFTHDSQTGCSARYAGVSEWLIVVTIVVFLNYLADMLLKRKTKKL